MQPALRRFPFRFQGGGLCITDYTGPPNCAKWLLGSLCTSMKYSRQCRLHMEDHSRPGQPIHSPAQVPVTNFKAPRNFTICCLSQFKEDTGKPSVSAQLTNIITYLLQMTKPGYEPRPVTVQSTTVTIQLQRWINH